MNLQDKNKRQLRLIEAGFTGLREKASSDRVSSILELKLKLNRNLGHHHV